MRLPRVVVIGSSNTDLVLQCARLPKPGESVVGGEFAQYAGGKGANQAVAAARAGAKVTFVGAYGDDHFGRGARAGLRSEGIGVRYFTKRTGSSSGVALILVGGRTRENLIAVARSANDTIQPADVERARSAIASADIVVSQLEVPLPAVEATARLATACGKPLILNPAPARNLPRRLLQQVHVLTPNENEALCLTGASEPCVAARLLREEGCRNVVITLGARGAYVSNSNGDERFPARRIRAVDTVGAGDCFTAWLAVGLARGETLLDAARLAIKAASISVTRRGAQAGMPTRGEVCSD